MAWAQQLPNGQWRAFWRDEDKRRRSSTKTLSGRPLTSKASAERHASEQESKARRGEATYAGHGTPWGVWCEQWLSLRSVEPSTANSDTGRINNHLMPYWGKTRIEKIRRDDVQRWVNQLNEDQALSPSTVLRILYLLSASMKAAVRSGLIAANPCATVDRPRPAPHNEHYLTRTEFDLVCYHMRSPKYRAAAQVLAGTGMRWGELAGLHWSRVDLDHRTVTVAETWDVRGQRVKGYPKSKKPRVVPLPSFAVEALLSQLLATPLTNCGHPHAKGSACTSGLVFNSEEGHPLANSTMTQNHWAPACKRAGVGHTRLHDVRHSYASWVRQNGVDIQVLQELLGHGAVTTTARYSHIGSVKHQQVLDALGG